MFVDKDSIVINGLSVSPYLLEVKYGYHKLWGKDTGRNLAGENSGTLLGIFPKLTLQFRRMDREELYQLALIMDTPTQTVTYFDAYKNAYVTMETYTGDWEVVNKNLVNYSQKNDGFSIAFIATKKRV